MRGRLRLLMASFAGVVFAQVLKPAELGLPGWAVGDPFEVIEDGEEGFWVRGPGGVLAVDGELRPRPHAATLYAATRGGLEAWRGAAGILVLRRQEGLFLHHRDYPQGVPTTQPLARPAPPSLPLLDVESREGWAVDLGGRLLRGGVPVGVTVPGSTSVSRAPEGVWLATAQGRLILFEPEGRRVREWEEAGSPGLRVASGTRGVAIDPTGGRLWVILGSKEPVRWNFLQAAEAEVQRWERLGLWGPREDLARLVLAWLSERGQDGGEWPHLLNQARSIRTGFSKLRLSKDGTTLAWALEPDDGDTRLPLVLIVQDLPLEAEAQTFRQAPYQGSVVRPLPWTGAVVQFIRGREIQEGWLAPLIPSP